MKEIRIKIYSCSDLKNNYVVSNKALKDWDREIKKIRNETEELIMMK